MHRTLPASALTRALTVAATAGQFDPDLVAVTARRIIAADAATPSPILLPENATGAVSGYRPTPSLAGYDQLLNGVSA